MAGLFGADRELRDSTIASRAACIARGRRTLYAPFVQHIRCIGGSARAVVVILALTLAVTALPGATLCVASDGHVAIEALGSDCAPDAAIAPLAGHAVAPLTASLHSCTDTLLAAPSLKQRDGIASQIVASSLWAVPMVLAPVAVPFVRLRDPQGSPPAAAPRSLSTVRLL